MAIHGGGLLAALYAAEFPDNVDRLVLIAPANMLVMPQPKGTGDLFDSVRTELPEDKQVEYDKFLKEYMDFGSLFSKTEDDLVALNERFADFFGESTTIDVAIRKAFWRLDGLGAICQHGAEA